MDFSVTGRDTNLQSSATPESSRPISEDASLTLEEKTRKDLEQDIVRHETAIIDTKRRLNMLIRFARIPPELLTEIFIHYRDLVAYSVDLFNATPANPYDRSGRRGGPYHWIRITHVCHHWREVAIAAPRLWSTIYMTSRMECVEQMLGRAKQALLRIQPSSSQASREIVERVLGQLHRITTFDIRSVPTVVALGEGASASRLQELVLRSSVGHRDMFPNGSGNQLQNFFTRCELPSLRSLDISGFSVRWSTALLKPTLKYLKLHGHAVQGSLTLNDVLDALQGTPLLEELDLKDVLPAMSDHEQVADVTRVVHLSHLKVLKIHNMLPCCYSLLRHTSFPKTATLYLNCSVMTPADTNRLMSVVADKYTAEAETEGASSLRSMSIHSLSEFDGISLKAWRAFHTVTQLSGRSIAPPEPDLHITLRLNGVAIATLGLLSAVPSTSLESLCLALRGRKAATKRDLLTLFEGLEGLRELGVDRWAQTNLPRVLEHRVYVNSGTTTKSGRRRKQPCIPKLSLLFLEDVIISNLPGAEAATGVIACIRKALVARQKSKVHLDKLVIRHCVYFTDEDKKLLEGVVGVIDCDNCYKNNVLPVYQYDSTDEDDEEELYEGEFLDYVYSEDFEGDYDDWDDGYPIGFPF